MSNGHVRAIETDAFVRDTIEGGARAPLVPCVAVVDDDDAIRFLVETLLKRDRFAAAIYPSAKAFLDAPDSRSARFLVRSGSLGFPLVAANRWHA